MNGALSWTPTLETIFDFMGVKQLQTRDLNFLIQRYKLIRCLIPVTYFKRYFKTKVAVRRPVYETNSDGLPIIDENGDQVKAVGDEGEALFTEDTKEWKRIRKYKSGDTAVKGDKDDWDS